MPEHRPGLHPAGKTGADDQVSLAGCDRRQQTLHLSRVVAVIPIQEYNHLGGYQGSQTSQTSEAIATPRLGNYPRSSPGRNDPGIVFRSVIHNDHLPDPRRDLGQHQWDGPGFVQRWDDDVDVHR